ncbi:MAG: Xaa-Pro peptidase family protein [Gemmatimonadaceae bacterium]|jgi:Xaa-Pro aminopeptidase|nr:Xaa-Pro peptidase family protein [Gemmatimonadaceae bacterium]
MSDRRSARVAALQTALTDLHLDALLVTALPNVRYLTGFSGSNALLVVTARGELLLITDFRYETQVADEVGDLARTVIADQSTWAALWRELPGLPALEVIGFEGATLVHRDFERLLGDGARWQWRPVRDVVEALRERKDPDELALIETAAAMAVAALEATLPAVRPGLTETAVAGLLERALREAGSEGYPFPTIVASGPRSALPHARSSGRAIAPGDFLLLDFGAVHGGYCSDITRTVVVGRADPEQRALYEAVAAAQAHACAGVRAGMTGAEADALARDHLAAAGLAPWFGHSLGHGIGLEVHEGPRLAASAGAILPLDAVVTVEPGVYRPGWGGVRIEDDVHLSSAGPRRLTEFTRALLEVG